MRFRALDGFRGLAALVVAVYHLPIQNHLLGERFFLPHAQMLMDFFFVMSGFIIAAAYGDRLATWSDVGRFAKSRFLRLWPLHIAMLVLLVALEAGRLWGLPTPATAAPFAGDREPIAILTNVLLIHSLHLHPGLTWNFPSWTISVEFFTYLIFAGSVVLWPKRQMASAVVLAVIGGLGVVFVARSLESNHDWGLLRCLYGFACGMLTWRLFRALPSPPEVARRLRLDATVLEVATTLGTFGFMAVLGGSALGYLGPLVFAVFIWVYAAEAGALTRWLAKRPTAWLGQVSYSIYLVHAPVIVLLGLAAHLFERCSGLRFTDLGVHGVEELTFVTGNKWLLDGVMLSYLGLVVFVAGLTHRWIEIPFHKGLFARTQRSARVIPSAEALAPQGNAIFARAAS